MVWWLANGTRLYCSECKKDTIVHLSMDPTASAAMDDDSLEDIYDEAYFEAMELQKKLP